MQGAPTQCRVVGSLVHHGRLPTDHRRLALRAHELLVEVMPALDAVLLSSMLRIFPCLESLLWPDSSYRGDMCAACNTRRDSRRFMHFVMSWDNQLIVCRCCGGYPSTRRPVKQAPDDKKLLCKLGQSLIYLNGEPLRVGCAEFTCCSLVSWQQPCCLCYLAPKFPIELCFVTQMLTGCRKGGTKTVKR